jgi:probable RNA-binding protein EIF1AD
MPNAAFLPPSFPPTTNPQNLAANLPLDSSPQKRSELPIRTCHQLHTHIPEHQLPNKMGKPRRNLLATVAETTNPPAQLEEGHTLARITKNVGNSLYSVELPAEKDMLLVELNPKFRSAVWVKRGTYVLVDRRALADRDNKLDGEIVNVVRDEKEWRKRSYW